MFDWIPRPENDNAIGLHDDGNAGDGPSTIGFMYGLVDGMADLGFKWLKLLMDANHKSGRLPLIEHARCKGLMVIARPFRQPCHPHGLDLYDDYLKAVIGAGCPYIEVGNEPNLAAVECWKPYNEYKYGENTVGHAAFVNLLYDQWLRNADKIRRHGGIPLFPAMSPTAYTSNDVYFHHLLYDDILGLGKLRGNLAWAFEGAGVAVHNRPCGGQPLDVLDRCAFRDYENIERKFEKALGRKIPLFGTEAGYEDGMVGDYIKHQLGNLYPNNQDYIRWHKVLNHDLYSRFNPDHEKPWHDYLICECAWLAADDGWYASGWARNARMPNGGPLPSYTDMREISNFTRAEGAPYEPPIPVPEPPPVEPQPPSDEVEFVGLCEEMIDRLTISGPNDPSLPYWKVYRVEIQPETDNMSAFAVLPPGTNVGVQFWNGGQFNAAPKADPYAPPGAKSWAASMPMFACWGSYGVQIIGNSEAIHGFGLYGLNLELTHTAHRPTLIWFKWVEPSEPEPPEPPVGPEPIPDIPYTLKARLAMAPHGFKDFRSQVEAISDMEAVRLASLEAGRIDAAGNPLFGNLTQIVLHHLGDEYFGVMPLVEWAIEEEEEVDHDTAPYHFLIEKSGRICWLVAVKYLTHHAYGANKHGIGIVFEDEANEKQMEAGRYLIASLYEFFGAEGWGSFRLTGLIPHSMVWNGDDWHTQCPGKVWPRVLWSGPWPKLDGL